jgi:hypothetical protein
MELSADTITSNEEAGLEEGRETGQDAGQTRDAEQEQEEDLTAMNVARAWGDLLGVEVSVRILRSRKFRLEVEFDFAAEGIALADRLAAAITRGSTRR